jgi:uroporphyrinogen-III synthase
MLRHCGYDKRRSNLAMPSNFQGLTVLTLENRRGQEISKMIKTYGGKPAHAAAMRELPLDSNSEALQFAEELFGGKFDVVIFLTGVGARAICNVVQTKYSAEQFLEALRKVSVFARGPKPVAVLREWNVPVELTAPEPNTWRELLQEIDRREIDLREKSLAVQEYGISNAELLTGLRERGARVKPVPVYQWDLPEDLGPLRSAIQAVIAGGIDVVLFTTGMQVIHLFSVAEQDGMKDALKAGLERVVNASIGPTTSEVLRSYGLSVDLEASHPKMGFLVKEAAEQSHALLARVRE